MVQPQMLRNYIKFLDKTLDKFSKIAVIIEQKNVLDFLKNTLKTTSVCRFVERSPMGQTDRIINRLFMMPFQPIKRVRLMCKSFLAESILLFCRGCMSRTGSIVDVNDVVLKKKILSLREHYDLEALDGTKLGEADGNLFQFPAKFVVVDSAGSPFMRLEGKVLSLRKQFTLYDATGAELGTMRKKLAKLIGEEYWVEKDGAELMRVYGNFTEHDYRLMVHDVDVASVHKKWFSVRDQLGVSITGDVDHRLVIGAVIVVEHVEVTEKQSSHQ